MRFLLLFFACSCSGHISFESKAKEGVDHVKVAQSVTRQDATCITDTEAGLVACIDDASPGDVIWVEDYASLVFSADGTQGQHILPLIRASDLTIASSGVGGLGGASVRVVISPNWQGDNDGPALFKVEGKPDTSIGETGDNFRLTGLRLIGPYPTSVGEKNIGMLAVEPFVKHSLTDTCESNGISVTCGGQPICELVPCGVTIDNNKMLGWSDSAVWVAHSEAEVKNNEITRNHDYYGVLVEGPSSVLVEGNTFGYNWHDITGDGHPLQRYTARSNYVLSNGDPRAQRFDVHPYCLKTGDCTGVSADVAGDRYIFEDNYFEMPTRHDFACPSLGIHHAPIVVRGIPSQGVLVSNNQFETGPGDDVWQFLCDPGYSSCVRDDCPETLQGISMVSNSYTNQ